MSAKAWTGVAVLLLLSLGCRQREMVRRLMPPVPAPAPVSYYRSPSLESEAPRRVALVPFEATGGCETVGLVTQAFAGELSKKGRFEIIFPPTEPAFFLPHTGPKADGTMDLDALVRARKELGVDAFLIGAITAHKPYDPPLLGLKVQLVSAKTGEVLWAADATFDGSEPDVRRLAMEFYKHHQEQDSFYGWKIVLISPDRFARFVSCQMLSTMEG